MAAKKTPTKKAPAKKAAAKKKKDKGEEKQPKSKRQGAKKNASFDLTKYTAHIDKECGAEILVFADDNVVGHSTGVVSSESIVIDGSIGVGGWPRGRVIELTGDEATGKSTLGAHAIKQCQAIGGTAFIVDTEEKFDRDYVKRLGVDVDKLVVLQPYPKTFESTIAVIQETLDYIVANGLRNHPTLILWDSVGATPTVKEYEAEEGDNAQVGGPSKQIRAMMRATTQRLAAAQTVLMCINHVYDTIPTGFAAKFGSKRVSYGGKGIRYAASLRLDLVNKGFIETTDGNRVGIKVLAKVIKNSVGAPQTNREFAILWGIGIDNTIPIFWALKDKNYVKYHGGWYTFATDDGTTRKWQRSHVGFTELCVAEPDFYAKCAEIYRAVVD